MKSVAIILAGGSGKRFGSYVEKQYMSLNGKQIIDYSIEACFDSCLFDKVIVVTKNLSQKYSRYVEVVPGGNTRNESVLNGINACDSDCNKIFFHDAARPFLKKEDIAQYLNALDVYDSAITTQPITDALYIGNRDKQKLIQTPEAFNYKKLKERFNINVPTRISIYDHMPQESVTFIELKHVNLKITNPEDIFIAEQLLRYVEPVISVPNLNDKNILIFGGTGGIGSECSKYLSSLGAFVLSLGSKDIDLSSSTYRTLNEYDTWHSIIYCAGAYDTDSDGMFNKSYDKIMNVNFRSFVSIIESINTFMLKGTVIALGSTAGMVGRPNIAIYGASKAALHNFIESVAPKYAKQGIYINCIAPAKVATPLQTKINPDSDQSKMIQPKDLAKIIGSYVITKDYGKIINVRVGEEKR